MEPLPKTPGILPPVAGYADDTALYLFDESKLLRATVVLEDIAIASGLHINKEKSVVMRLNAKAPPIASTCGPAILDDGKLCRYLGAKVGVNTTDAQVWKRALQQLEISLVMSQVKTHSVAQRAVLARSIIVSKLLFISRHHWPNRDTIADMDQRVRNLVWSGLFAPSSRTGTRGSRWMQSHQASLGHGAGGLAVPNFALELHTLAAVVVATWAYNPTGMMASTCALHDRSTAMIQPTLWLAEPPRQPALRDSIWDDGRAGLQRIETLIPYAGAHHRRHPRLTSDAARMAT